MYQICIHVCCATSRALILVDILGSLMYHLSSVNQSLSSWKASPHQIQNLHHFWHQFTPTKHQTLHHFLVLVNCIIPNLMFYRSFTPFWCWSIFIIIWSFKFDIYLIIVYLIVIKWYFGYKFLVKAGLGLTLWHVTRLNQHQGIFYQKS